MRNDLCVVWTPVIDIRVNERNARTHPENQIDKIARSIEEFGWTNPILLDQQQMIIAGHGRYLAALRLGLQAVPTITLANLSQEQLRAYVIADNALGDLSAWDRDVLAKELSSLQTEDVPISDLGLSNAEIKSLLDTVEREFDAGPKLKTGFVYRIIINCDSETHQSELMFDLEKRGIACQPSIL